MKKRNSQSNESMNLEGFEVIWFECKIVPYKS